MLRFQAGFASMRHFALRLRRHVAFSAASPDDAAFSRLPLLPISFAASAAFADDADASRHTLMPLSFRCR